MASLLVRLARLPPRSVVGSVAAAAARRFYHYDALGVPVPAVMISGNGGRTLYIVDEFETPRELDYRTGKFWGSKKDALEYSKRKDIEFPFKGDNEEILQQSKDIARAVRELNDAEEMELLLPEKSNRENRYMTMRRKMYLRQKRVARGLLAERVAKKIYEVEYLRKAAASLLFETTGVSERTRKLLRKKAKRAGAPKVNVRLSAVDLAGKERAKQRVIALQNFLKPTKEERKASSVTRGAKIFHANRYAANSTRIVAFPETSKGAHVVRKLKVSAKEQV